MTFGFEARLSREKSALHHLCQIAGGGAAGGALQVDVRVFKTGEAAGGVGADQNALDWLKAIRARYPQEHVRIEPAPRATPRFRLVQRIIVNKIRR
jgi:hypothetical protein